MASTESASTRMKALVVSRLMMGNLGSWEHFVQERTQAQKIVNRKLARSVGSQIGYSYAALKSETHNFLTSNFIGWTYDDLALMCDEIQPMVGIYLRLSDFEQKFFQISDEIKSRVPRHAHVSISLYGLQFEFPEHHFLRDIESGLKALSETEPSIAAFRRRDRDAKRERADLADLIAQEKFVSRSAISAAFSLVEAFLSGLFFEATEFGAVGRVQCDQAFIQYAKTRESAPMKDRLDKIARLITADKLNGQMEPFKSFMQDGKLYRDAIHHTTPFARKDLKTGGRLLALYEIDRTVALRCVGLALDSVLAISSAAYGETNDTAIGTVCHKLKELSSEVPAK